MFDSHAHSHTHSLSLSLSLSLILFSVTSHFLRSNRCHGLVKSETTGQLSYGFLAGYASGFVLKRVTRVGVRVYLCCCFSYLSFYFYVLFSPLVATTTVHPLISKITRFIF